jgi:hypothetical protein
MYTEFSDHNSFFFRQMQSRDPPDASHFRFLYRFPLFQGFNNEIKREQRVHFFSPFSYRQPYQQTCHETCSH